MAYLRHAVKAAIAHALYHLGILDRMCARALRHKAVVLMYHRVLSSDERATTTSHPGYVVSDATFARHMTLLKQRFHVLSEQEFVRHLDEGTAFPDASCLITFDDGWRDNLTRALPVLRAHGLPATVYLPVNFIGTRRMFWRESLTHVLLEALARWRRGEDRQRIGDVLRRHRLDQVLAITAPDPRQAVIAAVQQQGHRRMEDSALAEALPRDLGIDVATLDTVDTFISWAEAAEMAAHGVSFGAHGTEHRLLGVLPAPDAEFEVRESRRVVTDRLGAPVLTLAYPNGSVTPSVRAMVEAAGYRAAFTTEPGAVDARDDRFMLRRLNMHEDMTRSTPLFLARLAGLF